MIVKPVPTPWLGNSRFPLPDDYNDLSDEGQRLARVNGCRLWALDYDTIARYLYRKPFSACAASEQQRVMCYRQDAMVGSVNLFDRLYLKPITDEDGHKLYDSLFYGSVVLPRPSFHDDSLRLHAIHKYLAEVMPRGSAKTTDLRIAAMCKIVTRPAWDHVYVTASHPLAEITGSKIKIQLEENNLLNDDWSPEYDGHLKPDRGTLPWGTTFFCLRNRASFKISSVDSVQRGIRPDEYDLDDPEWDPGASTNLQVSREEMQHLITRVIVPMVQKPGASLRWRGTFVSQRHFLWAAMENKPNSTEPAMSEFKSWHRRTLDIVGPDNHSIWPAMWPTDEAEKAALRLPPETQTLPDVEQAMGTPAYMAEMRAQPGAGGPAFFGKLEEPRHGYWFEQEDEALLHHPLSSTALITWMSGTVKKQLPLGDFLRRFPGFIAVDPAYTENATSDYKVATLMTLTDANELFVLDTWWSNRLPLPSLYKACFQMAEQWGAAAICPEKIKAGNTVVAGLAEILRTNACDVVGVQSLCQVAPFNPGVIDKVSKIASLLPRFQFDKIKLPLRQSHTTKWMPMFQQIRDFNPEAADGGLKKDDHLDCWPEGTKVVTRRGEVEIQNIQVGDEVPTRKGWRRVQALLDRGVKSVEFHFGLEATPEHRIWTDNRGWVPLCQLRHGDIIRTWIKNESSLMAETITASSHIRAGIEETTTGINSQQRDPSRFTSPYGKIAMALCPRDTVSITKMRTPSTTILPILSASPTRSTLNGTREVAGNEVDQRSNFNFLRGSAPSAQEHPLLVRHAERPSWPSPQAATNTVQVHAAEGPVIGDTKKDIPDWPPLGEGHIAPSTLSETGQQSRNIGSRRWAKTYDLTVEDCHEFIASGVLVHNCVSMSAFIVRLPKLRRAAQTLISDSLARLRRGERTDKFGFPIVCSLRPEELTPEDIKCLHANPPPAKKHPSQYTI